MATRWECFHCSCGSEGGDGLVLQTGPVMGRHCHRQGFDRRGFSDGRDGPDEGIHRQAEAGAVLQTALLLIKQLSDALPSKYVKQLPCLKI